MRSPYLCGGGPSLGLSPQCRGTVTPLRTELSTRRQATSTRHNCLSGSKPTARVMSPHVRHGASAWFQTVRHGTGGVVLVFQSICGEVAYADNSEHPLHRIGATCFADKGAAHGSNSRTGKRNADDTCDRRGINPPTKYVLHCCSPVVLYSA